MKPNWVNNLERKWMSFYNSKYFTIFLFICFALIPFIIYGDFFRKDMLFVSGDGIEFFSNKTLIKQAVLNGELPLWNKYLAGGMPYAEDIYQGVFYPISFIMALLPLKLFVYGYYGIHLAIGGTFMYLLLRQLKCSQLTALAGSILYALSIHIGGMRKGHMVIIQAVVYLPVILYFLQKYFNTNKIRYLVLTSFAMAVQFLTGYIQIVLYADIAVFIYYLLMSIHLKKQVKQVIKEVSILILGYLGVTAIQLIPAMFFVYNYGQGVKAKDYLYFVQFSMHPIKFLMTIFPTIFGNNFYYAEEVKYSSEAGIEIFIGSIAILTAWFGVIRYYKKNIIIKLGAIIAAIAAVYAWNAHIPWLGKMLYNIPILGQFRCSARTLFIFVFFAFVIMAIVLEKIKDQNEFIEMSKYFEKAAKLILTISVPALMILVAQFFSSKYATVEYAGKYEYIGGILYSLMIIGGIWAITFFMRNISKEKYKKIYAIIIIAFVVLTVGETFKFYKQNVPTKISEIYNNPETAVFTSHIGNNKVIDLYRVMNSERKSSISQNRNILHGIAAINSYLPFNNPKLYRLLSGVKGKLNASGILTGFDRADRLAKDNSILSMLGVKYVIDSSALIFDDGAIKVYGNEQEEVFNIGVLTITSNNGKLNTFAKKVKIDPYTYYKIEMKVEYTELPKNMYMDFYGANNYDFIEQEIKYSGDKDFVEYIYSGPSDLTEEKYFRIVSESLTDITIKNMKLTKVEGRIEKNIYAPVIVEGKNRLFENLKVRDILYKPERVRGITSNEEIYKNKSGIDFAKESYILNFEDMDLEDVQTNIQVEYFKNNSIKATVNSDKNTFINFSQCGYTGWNAYIDGEKTEIYEVNTVIQGIKVPQGEHVIEFRFEPNIIWISGAIGILLLIGMMIIVKIDKKNHD